MNHDRRSRLEKAVLLIEEARDIIESCEAEERECYDNLSEGLQASERGQKYEENADTLADVVAELENQTDNIRQAQE